MNENNENHGHNGIIIILFKNHRLCWDSMDCDFSNNKRDVECNERGKQEMNATKKKLLTKMFAAANSVADVQPKRRKKYNMSLMVAGSNNSFAKYNM